MYSILSKLERNLCQCKSYYHFKIIEFFKITPLPPLFQIKTAKTHERYSKRGWQLDKTTIFAQIDVFIQRCRDLIDICDCEVHFANYEYGE
jgi:hypothetical protein